METLSELLENDLSYINRCLAGELEQMAGRRLLITGGAGFLGYYMVQGILYHNRHAAPGDRIDITVYDNYIRGVPQWLEALAGKDGLTLKRHDVRNPLPGDIGHMDYIVHAAGIASPIYYRLQPIETMDANINGLRSLLEYARTEGDNGRPLSGFIFYSSSEIYGDPSPEWIPTPEHYRGYVSCTGPRACYDESKRYGETLCVNFAQQYGVPVRQVRPFNNYGPGLKISDRRVLPDFAGDVMAGRDIVMLSDGSPTRTFCYSADAVCGYYKALVRGKPGDAYNVGIDRPEISMRDLAGKVVDTARALFGYAGKVVHQPPKEDDYLVDNPNRRCPDMTHSREALGYNPTILIDEGVRRSMVWYHYNREGADA